MTDRLPTVPRLKIGFSVPSTVGLAHTSTEEDERRSRWKTAGECSHLITSFRRPITGKVMSKVMVREADSTLEGGDSPRG